MKESKTVREIVERETLEVSRVLPGVSLASARCTSWWTGQHRFRAVDTGVGKVAALSAL